MQDNRFVEPVVLNLQQPVKRRMLGAVAAGFDLDRQNIGSMPGLDKKVHLPDFGRVEIKQRFPTMCP